MFYMYRLFIILLISFGGFGAPVVAQVAWTVHADLGYAWGGADMLDGFSQPGRALVSRTTARLNYRIDRFSASLGVGGKWLLPYGEFQGAAYRGNALRAVIPVDLSYRVGRAWWLGLGYELQNERDLLGLDPRRRYVYRHNWSISAQYEVHPRWRLSLTTYRPLADNPDQFFIADPKHTISLGTVYQLNQDAE